MNYKVLAGGAALGLLSLGAVAYRQVQSYPATDGVSPVVTADVALDSATGDFVYRYSIANGASAAQRINQFFLVHAAEVTGGAAPPDWSYDHVPPLPGEAPDTMQSWGATGEVDPAWVPHFEGDLASFASEVAPGETLSGFEIRSPCAAAVPLRYYAVGYNHLPRLGETEEAPYVGAPGAWWESAASGSVAGPGDCGTVREWGNRRPGVDGFMGLVNFASGAVLPAGPVTLQIRFARAGEQVDGASFRAELNRVDVTPSFLTNTRGDRVAVFAPGSSPLRQGGNVLLISVDGIKSGTSQTATDADRITFTAP